MTDIKAVRLPASITSAKQWLAPGLVVIYQILSILALVVIPIFAINWIKTPFLGAFVEHTLQLSASQPSIQNSWPLINQIDEFGSQLVAIDGQPIEDVFRVNKLLAGYSTGDSVVVTLHSPQRVQENI